MVDLASAPRIAPSSNAGFDRSAFPVRYYFVDFSKASRAHGASAGTTNPEGEAHAEASSPFEKDVKECGIFLDQMLQGVSIYSLTLCSLRIHCVIRCLKFLKSSGL